MIVCTHDDGEFLEGCLDSIEAQTLAPHEIIVVDDGTNDPSSLEAIEQAGRAFPDVRFIRQDNLGAAAARNRGLKECRGDLVAFVDADDRLRPDNLAVKQSFFDHDPRIVAAYGGYETLGPMPLRSRFRSGKRPLDPSSLGKPGGLPGGLPLFLFAAGPLRATGGLDSELVLMEDFDLLIRLGRQGGLFAGSNEPIYFRTVRPGSLSRGSAALRYREIRKFLSKARREGYFSRGELLRRHALALAERIKAAFGRR